MRCSSPNPQRPEVSTATDGYLATNTGDGTTSYIDDDGPGAAPTTSTVLPIAATMAAPTVSYLACLSADAPVAIPPTIPAFPSALPPLRLVNAYDSFTFRIVVSVARNGLSTLAFGLTTYPFLRPTNLPFTRP